MSLSVSSGLVTYRDTIRSVEKKKKKKRGGQPKSQPNGKEEGKSTTDSGTGSILRRKTRFQLIQISFKGSNLYFQAI